MPATAPDLRIGAAYIRVSTDDQVEYSPASQLVEIRKYARAHDILVPDEYIFVDEGISGRSTDKRPSFNRMIGTAKTKPKPFDVILLWKFSRFARSREDSILYKSMLRRDLGIEVVSISEPVGDDKMSIIIEAMIEAMEKHAIQDGKKGGSGADAEEDAGSDPMFKQAVDVVIDAGQASTSLLQRRCKLGYARAARIMDEMEQKSIIGPYEGAKPRAVLISRQQWLEMQMNQPEE